MNILNVCDALRSTRKSVFLPQGLSGTEIVAAGMLNL